MMLLLAAPVAASAFYLRYGTAPAIVLIGIAAILAWPRPFREASRQVAATCILLIVLLVPHLYESLVATGSPWGIVVNAQSQVATQDALGTFAQFVEWLAGRLGGAFGVMLIATGTAAWLAIVALDAFRRQWSPVSRRLTFLVPPAVGLTLLLSVAAHAEPRYIFLPVVQLLIAGGVAVAMVLNRLRRPRQRWLVASLGAVAALVWGMDGAVNSVEVQAAYAPTQWDIVDAGHAVRNDANGDCVVITELRPQLTWYSGCQTLGFGAESHGGVADGGVESRYLLVYSGRANASDRDDIERHLASGCQVPATIIFDQASGDEAGRIYRLGRECSPAAEP